MTCPNWLYFGLAIVLLLLNGGCAALNLLALPGNWLVLVSSLAFALLFESRSGASLSLSAVGIMAALALLGEGVELLAGTAGAAKRGASRRSLALSVVGSIAGSLLGATIGLPIPVLGSAFGALLGGAAGAFAGAALGEDWKGRGPDQSLAVGQAAFWGRLWGTVGKTAIGVAMVMVATIDSFFVHSGS